ncbi:MAG: hypothetical protein AAF620_19270 [Bacteroidota bacterium]
MKQVTVFVIIVGAMLITACSEYESAKPDQDVDLSRAKAIWLDAQSKNGGRNNGRVVDQLTPLFEQYSQHLAHNELPFLKIPVATQNKVVHHMEGVDTDLELGTYLLYVDNHDGENLYLVNVILGEGNNFNNGLVTVHDLAGQYIVGYRFQDGEYLLVGEEREINQNGRSSGVECWYVDHYTCTVRVGPDDCELDYTTVHCEYYADKPRLIFGDGSGEGGGPGEGSSLTGPVQCDDGYFADEQGRCINTCGPSMVSDGNGGCVSQDWEEEDQTVGKLCADATFQLTGSGFTAEISNLGLTAINYRESKVINVDIFSSCVTIPSYSLSNGAQAAIVFSTAFNNARENVYKELSLDEIEESSAAVRKRLIELIKYFINDSVRGSTFSSTNCQGSIPISKANYGC